MLEGAEKFLRGNEMIGKYLLDLKEFTHSNDCQIKRLENELDLRLTRVEYQALTREKSKKLKNKLNAYLTT